MSTKRKITRLSLLVIFLSLLIIYPINSRENKPIKAAIIPHHLVADSFIIDLSRRLSHQPNISEIIIIGPNHDEVGDEHLTFNLDVVNRDHVCFAPRTIIKSYLSTVPINCLLVSARSTSSEIKNMASLLANRLENGGVLVASVDFSHYLPLQNANINDLTTQKHLDTFDADSLLPLGNSFLDSPKTIALLFEYLRLIKVSEFQLINHSNSAIIYDIPSLSSTTSYFEYIYF